MRHVIRLVDINTCDEMLNGGECQIFGNPDVIYSVGDEIVHIYLDRFGITLEHPIMDKVFVITKADKIQSIFANPKECSFWEIEYIPKE